MRPDVKRRSGLSDRWKKFIAAAAGVALMGTLFPLAALAQEGPPPVPHDIDGREQCLTCHSGGAMVPFPAGHEAFSEDMCLSCHAGSASAEEPEPVPTPAPEPAPEPSSAPENTPVPAPESAPVTEAEGSEACLVCHGQPGLTMELDSGETLALYIDSEIYAASVHGDKLLCTDCHTDITGYPHPARDIASQREYNVAQYELCKRCHFDNYTKTLDSIHYTLLSDGDLQAPICTDCHGAHDVSNPSEPRAKISQTCSQCHGDIYEEYVDSVHGIALLQDDNYDVPVCTDCHQSHTIEDPRTASFRLESVHLCSNCHSDADLMAKYGISPNVVKTYLNDFHGRTVALVEKESRDIWVQEAVCTDCHGIHDIQAVTNANSPVIKANLVATCGQCHEDVSTNFPGAWLSHYEPNPEKTPLIFFTEWFYRIMIPFVLVGLSIHVVLDLWKRITNR